MASPIALSSFSISKIFISSTIVLSEFLSIFSILDRYSSKPLTFNHFSKSPFLYKSKTSFIQKFSLRPSILFT